MSDKLRAEFEKWWDRAGFNTQLLYWQGNDHYRDGTVQIAWQAFRAAHARYEITPERFIRLLRGSERHIEALFTMGGCYQFVKLLQEFYPSTEPMIAKDGGHAAGMIDSRLYDITGEVDPSGFREATLADLIEMESWTFDRHHMLSVGECPNCEEPIVAPQSQQS